MKRMKKLCAVIISILMLISCLTVMSFAAETDTQDGLTAVIQTDKDSYSANEDIHITITVKNTNTFEVKNVSIETFLPEGLTLKDGKLKSKAINLKAGETLTLTCVAILEKEEPTPTEPSTETTEVTTETTEPTTEYTSEVETSDILPIESSTNDSNTNATESISQGSNSESPDTGDNTVFIKAVMVLITAIAVAAFIVIITKKNNKKATKVISLILCGAVAVSSFATVGFIKVGAEGRAQLLFSVDETVTIDDVDYTIKANVSYDKVEEEQTTWYQGIDEDHVVNSEKDGSGFDYINNRIIILFKMEATEEQKQAAVDVANGVILGVNESKTEYQVEIHETQTLDELREICDEISSMSGVAICYVEKLYELNTVPNDPWKDVFEGALGTDWDEKNPDGLNWWLETIQAPSAWDYNERFSNIKIGIVDNGFDTNHEDLEISVINPNHNEIDTIPDHGTHVAGVIGATANNDVGITGIVWNKEMYCADVLPTKTQTENQVSILSTYDGIKELLKKGCKVINQSLGCTLNSPEWIINEGKIAVSHIIEWKEELNSDFIVVQSAGNAGIDSRRNGSFASITDEIIDAYFSEHPDAAQKHTKSDIYQHFMIVGAIEQDGDSYKLCDAVSGFLEPTEYNSNYGESVSIVAPGMDIYSCSVMGGVNGNYVSLDGTSMATPIVTGVASLVWSVNPEFTADEVKDIVCTSTDKTASSSSENDSRESYPIVNAKLAVEEAIRRTDNKLCSVSGFVVDAETKEPIEATVEISRLGETFERKTNPQDGTFLFENLESGEYTIRITSPGYQFIYTTFNISEGTDYQVLGEFNLSKLPEQKTTITGYVKDKNTEKYLSGVTVTAYDEKGTEVINSTVTEKNGYYEIFLEKEGIYDLKFSKDNYDEYILDDVKVIKGMNGLDPVYLSPVEDGQKTYYISTPEEFNNIRNDITGHYILMNDIDLSDYAKKWEPIGLYSNNSMGFSGHFNGNGHTIYGFNVSEFYVPYPYEYNTWGLFGFLNSYAVIENLNLEGSINLKSAYAQGSVYLGSIAGTGWGTIKNCSFRGYIFADIDFPAYESELVEVGGIAGSSWYGGDMTIIDCKNYGSVQIMPETNRGVYVGGIIARGTAKHCYNAGNITCFTIGDTTSYVMGITFDQAIDCCNAAGSMNADSYYHSVVVCRISYSDYNQNCVANKDMLINGKTVNDSVENGTGMSSDLLTDWYNKNY